MSAESSPATRAVFLSYASQDAEAARRMCEALRAIGVEVWFDQNELVGGDAWDAKIRKQISECGLFVTIISAATQARDEGYFRLEWKLAVDRSHLMVHDKAFLLPVVIDATTDAAARVPPEFRAVQWTRLPGGETTAAFCARVKKLLGGSGGERASRPVGSESTGQETRAPAKHAPARSWLLPVALGAAALIALAIWQPWRAKETVAPASPPLASVPAKPLTEAQQLVAKARKILDEGDELNRETYVLAEELLKKSEGLDLTDASAWSLHAELSSRMFIYGFDRAPARREALQSQAARAAKLAPATPEAEVALAYAQIVTGQDISGLQERLTKLTDKFPNEPHLNRVLSIAGMSNRDVEVAIAATQRALKRAPDNPEIKADLFYVLSRNSKWTEAEQALRGALTGRQVARFWGAEMNVKLFWLADVDGAVAAVEQWPAWYLAEDRGCSQAALTYLCARKPDRMLSVLGKVPRDYLRDANFSGPRAVLTAWAHEAANETEAALADWHVVVQLADRELANTPDDTWAMHWKAWALARLGDREAARKFLRILEERNADISNSISRFTGNFAGLALVADSKDAAIARLARYVASGETSALGNVRPLTRAMLRVNPVLESLHGDPRFEAIVTKAPGPEEKPTTAASVSLDEKAVAVLPFANLSGDKEQEYFSDGLTEEILNALARERDLRVPGRTSSFSFKGKNASAAEIATALNVSRLVEGSVQRSGTKVRIRVSLTRVADNASEEVGTFTEELADIFALQDKVARAVVEKLTHRATKGTVEALTKNTEAYDAYLRGRALQTRSAANRDEAAKLYERAVELDPSFALAWARLAEARFRSYGAGSDRSAELVTATRAAIDRALQAQPDLPEALIMRANWSRYAQGDLAAAQRDLARAEALQAPTAELRLAQGALARERDDYPEATRQAQACLSLDPQNGDNTNATAVTYYYPRGDYMEADRLLMRAVTITGPGEWNSFNNRVLMRMRWRGAEAALRLAERAPAGQVRAEFIRAYVLIGLGRVAEAKALIDEAERRANAAAAASPASLGGPPRAHFLQLYDIGELDLARSRAEGARTYALKQVARGNRGPSVMATLVSAEFVIGHREAALAAMEEMRRDARGRPGVFLRIYDVGSRLPGFYAQLGKPDEEIAMIREHLDAGFHFGYELKENPDYAPVRADPRFQAMMKQEEAWAKALPDPVDP